ncbi:hypothetical protein PENTCL1PPCAC_16780, partial [Pristionchus entomophagus]
MPIEITRLIRDPFCTISFLLNILLIALIYAKATDNLRSYSILLLNFVIIEIITELYCLFVFNRVMVKDGYDFNAITGPCRLTGKDHLSCAFYAVMMQGHTPYSVLLAFGFCYRFYVIKYSTPTNTQLLGALFLAYAPTLIVYVS